MQYEAYHAYDEFEFSRAAAHLLWDCVTVRISSRNEYDWLTKNESRLSYWWSQVYCYQ
jgi:hypothetical protein